MGNQALSFSDMVSWDDGFDTGDRISHFFGAPLDTPLEDEALALNNISDPPQTMNHNTHQTLSAAAVVNEPSSVSAQPGPSEFTSSMIPAPYQTLSATAVVNEPSSVFDQLKSSGSTSSTTPIPPQANIQKENRTNLFRDADVAYLARIIGESLTSRKDFSDIQLCERLLRTLQSRMHHPRLVTRILLMIDSFSPDPNSKRSPMDHAFSAVCKSTKKQREEQQAIEQEKARLHQEYSRLRQQYQRLETNFTRCSEALKSSSQPHLGEVCRLQDERLRLQHSVERYKQHILAQDGKIQQMQSSLTAMASVQRRQAPQPLSADQVRSRYIGLPLQQQAAFTSPAPPMPTKQDVATVLPPLSTPIQQSAAVVLSAPPMLTRESVPTAIPTPSTLIKESEAANMAVPPSIPRLSTKNSIDLTLNEGGAQTLLETNSPTPNASNKRRYDWMNVSAKTTAPLPPNKKAKSIAKAPTAAKGPTKKPAPKVPKGKVSRRASKKDRQELVSHNATQLKEYQGFYSHLMSEKQNGELGDELEAALRKLAEQKKPMPQAKEVKESGGRYEASLEDQAKHRQQVNTVYAQRGTDNAARREVQNHARRGMQNDIQTCNAESNTEDAEGDDQDDEVDEEVDQVADPDTIAAYLLAELSDDGDDEVAQKAESQPICRAVDEESEESEEE
ncbi:MAG: hypothetical protein LQ346_000081 [Caloplaca aetnensis]|nr:MAG: hypothetical protein LQ346_000081 [Caloplaca aetnensis]